MIKPSPTDKGSKNLLSEKISSLAPYLFCLVLWAVFLGFANLIVGSALAPGPLVVLKKLWELIVSGQAPMEMAVTVSRALLGAFLANLVGVLLALPVGRSLWALKLTSPLVAGLQSCPPVVWVALVMVWAGTGSWTPVVTVFAATLPFVFSTIAQGVLGLDPRISALSRLYDVPALRYWFKFAIPAITPHWLSGLSSVLATGWKAAAVAEFLGSGQGVGARLYWSYSQLKMEEFQAWALALIVLGLSLESAVITPLRRRAAQMAMRSSL
ncbi:MAG: ABC transporter permease subunit [Deltaproteobacteria bacterium]|jgi:NitT/TauT family transport system permease protein|nr:ABC transporter permease subunit [Deltaproteobacteria bacterium]